VRTASDPCQQDEPADGEHDHVDGAGEKEQAARAPEDLPRGQAGQVKQPAADCQRADATAGQERT
jgi:hypothetical protein